MNVLICDDHVVFADSLAQLIEAHGTDVAAVTYHPDDAIRLLRATSVDVCILDLMFGEDSALDRLADIRQSAPDTRFVILTGRLDYAVISAGRAAGIAGFAEKVQSARDILTLIERVSGGDVVIPEGYEHVPRTHAAVQAPSQTARRLASFLTPRERQVLSGLVAGSDTAALAHDLRITQATVRCHVQRMLVKMNVHSRLEAATTAVRHGLLDPETAKWLQ